MTDRYAVIGNPIKHSLSPLIHKAFALQTGEDISYERILCELDTFEETVDKFFLKGGKGLNVTLPFKNDAFYLSKRKSDFASKAEAVNTITRKDNIFFGDNTDGVGLIRDLCINNQLSLVGCNILLIGAGGAAKGIVHPLLKENPKKLTITNRTLQRAVDLAHLSNDDRVNGCDFDDLNEMKFDIVINATSVSLTGDSISIPDNCLSKNSWVYDMMYSNKPTGFMEWGIRNGADKVLNGFGMLVEQAAQSFLIWRGVLPNTNVILSKSNSFLK
tara:strand:- start:979 stop:1797 length:819 start_codon:yes stop_codon:yes gene_type:complete